MDTIYNVDYFIKKFEAIPEEKWCTGSWKNGESCCANGHCGVMQSISPTNESESLKNIFSVMKVTEVGTNMKIEETKHGIGYSYVAVKINDGLTKEYQQLTPKQRILAALYDIKKMQQPEYPDLTKELAVLPKDEVSDKVIKPEYHESKVHK